MLKCRAAAEKALALDESLPEAHTSLAANRQGDWDWRTAEKEYRRAIELNPSYATARHWYALFLAAMNRPAEAVAEAKRAQELDPLSLVINADLAQVHYFARQYNDAIVQAQRTLGSR